VAGRSEELGAVYELLPLRDFSLDLLQRACDSLTVVATPACGWSDLGVPERVASCLAFKNRRAPAGSDGTPGTRSMPRPVALGLPAPAGMLAQHR
jgi:hypothetical protein